eukprot:2346622-Karenia_brevis.AAC.1
MRDESMRDATPKEDPQIDPAASRSNGDLEPGFKDEEMQVDYHSSCPSLQPPTSDDTPRKNRPDDPFAP